MINIEPEVIKIAKKSKNLTKNNSTSRNFIALLKLTVFQTHFHQYFKLGVGTNYALIFFKIKLLLGSASNTRSVLSEEIVFWAFLTRICWIAPPTILHTYYTGKKRDAEVLISSAEDGHIITMKCNRVVKLISAAWHTDPTYHSVIWKASLTKRNVDTFCTILITNDAIFWQNIKVWVSIANCVDFNTKESSWIVKLILIARRHAWSID